MIVLVGTREYNIKNGKIDDLKCPNCQIQTSMNFSIYAKYTHITLIPLFPVEKNIYTKCDNCDHNFELKDFSEETRNRFINEKRSKDVRNPIWMYIGSFIFLCFIIYISYNYIQTKDKTEIYIKNPKQGDVYNLKFSNGYYSTMRIDKVVNDSVYATQNDFDAYLPYEVDEIDKPENYTKVKVYYSKDDLIKLYQKNEVFSITRKRTTYE